MPGSDTRQRILDAAAELFLAKGYNDATVAEIIEAAETNKGSFYHHFEDKQHLAYNICRAITDGIESDVKRIHPELPPLERLFLQECLFWRVFFTEPSVRRFVAEVYAVSYVSVKADVFDAILDAAPNGLSSRDLLMIQGLELALRMTMTAYVGSISERLVEEDFVRFYLNLWLGAYGIAQAEVARLAAQAYQRLAGLGIACRGFTLTVRPAPSGGVA